MRTSSTWISAVFRLAPFAAIGLWCAAPEGQARVQHVVHISVDGLRGDMLRALLDSPGQNYPAFARLRAEGAFTFNARCDFASSSTIPNHTSMITGLPLAAPAAMPDAPQHGYSINYLVAGHTLHANGLPVQYKPSVFDRVHDRGGRTMLLASKEKFELFDRSYDAEHGAPDADGEDNGRRKIDFTLIQNGDSSILAAVLLAHMGGDFPAYTFLHIFDPDYAGHLYGWGSMSWVLAVKHADSLLGLLLSALELRPALKAKTALVITADHGGGVPSWNHTDPLPIENVTIPVIIWGPGVPPGVDAHSLFANRRDPGAARPDNDVPAPPLRNGDTGNIALALLGLPPVPGSFYRPEWKGGLRVTTEPDGQVLCAWPRFMYGWTLESTAGLQESEWSRVPLEPHDAGSEWRHLEPLAPSPQRYYRLRRPQ